MIATIRTQKNLAEMEYIKLDMVYKNLEQNSIRSIKIAYANTLLHVLKIHFPKDVENIEYLRNKNIPIFQKRKMIEFAMNNKNTVLEKTLDMTVEKMIEVSVLKSQLDELLREEEKVNKIIAQEKNKVKEYFEFITNMTNIYLMIREYIQYLNLIIKRDNTEDKDSKGELWRVLAKKRNSIKGYIHTNKFLSMIFPEIKDLERDEKMNHFPTINIFQTIDTNEVVEKKAILEQKLQEYKEIIENRTISPDYNDTSISEYTSKLSQKYKEDSILLIKIKNLGEESKKLIQGVIKKTEVYKMQDIN